MIKTAEEFKKLRESEIPEEYHRASNEEAEVHVWGEVIEKYKEMAIWVAQNKTVPVAILKELATHEDPNVRCMVARKRKLPESTMLLLAKDSDESVRNGLVNNGKVTKSVLRVLVTDSWDVISERASQKLTALTSPST